MILNIYDDGEGLSQEFSNNPNEIFQFRKTGKNNGTGFGLYLVQESLRKMNSYNNCGFSSKQNRYEF